MSPSCADCVTAIGFVSVVDDLISSFNYTNYVTATRKYVPQTACLLFVTLPATTLPASGVAATSSEQHCLSLLLMLLAATLASTGVPPPGPTLSLT